MQVVFFREVFYISRRHLAQFRPVCSGYLRTERTPVSAPANHRALRRRFYTLCMPKSEVQEALSSYFSSFVSRSAELEKSFLSYRVCRLDSGLYILSVTKVSEIMRCEQFIKLLYNLADFPHRPCFTLISSSSTFEPQSGIPYFWDLTAKWEISFKRAFQFKIATKKEVL